MDKEEHVKFYEKEFHGKIALSINQPFSRDLQRFIARFQLADKKILEIGSGQGHLQDVVEDYTGIDIVDALRPAYHKPFFAVKPHAPYPFADGAFDAIFTYAVFEHIIDIEHALHEMLRVLKPGGYVLFSAAWQVRPWASQGYAVRSYGDLGLRGKLIKFSILWRDTVVFRSLSIFPKRIWRTIIYFFNRNAMKNLDYKKVKANYEKFWTPDSDACNSIDPHAMILWFFRNGCEVLNYPNPLKALFVRSGNLMVRKNKP